MDSKAYYHDVTSHYTRYGGDFGWHYGVWSPSVTSHHDALREASRLLVHDMALSERSVVLDVGCGLGGFLRGCCETFGCRGVGISICDEHVDQANRLAAEAGVADRCSFVCMDMNDLAFDHGSFDVVFNQESLCYAMDKGAYLRRVRQILRPGGQWSAITFTLRDEPLGAQEQSEYQKVRRGFHIPSLPGPSEVLALLDEAGFEPPSSEDLTARVAPTARYIVRHCHIPNALVALHLDWLVFGRDPSRRKNQQGHFEAGVAYSLGLLNGWAQHWLWRTRVA